MAKAILCDNCHQLLGWFETPPRQRRRLDEARLMGALAAYQEGGIAAVVEKEQVGERQAWRLIVKARELATPRRD